MFAGEKFDKYIFGRDVVHVATDHKPLEEIFKKSLCAAPARLQRMLLRLQSLSQVQERSPYVHRGYAKPCVSQGNVAFRGGEVSGTRRPY